MGSAESILQVSDFLYGIKWCWRSIFSNGITENTTCLVGKTAIVTGGSTGIGYATSVLLASRGCRVIIATNVEAEKEKQTIIDLTGNPNILVKHLDLSKLKSVREFADLINKEETKLDILINNAGVFATHELQTQDGLNTVMQINFFGHFLLTHLLIEKLRAAESAKVVFTASITVAIAKYDMKNLNYIPEVNEHTEQIIVNDYGKSKFCCLLAAQEFGKRLKNFGITVKSFDPGSVMSPIFNITNEIAACKEKLLSLFTDILAPLWAMDAFYAAQTPFHIAASKTLEEGSHYFRCKPFHKHNMLDDQKLCHEIWKQSEELVGLNPEEKLQ